ncbi:MAG: N-acyl homoserine lactonase family protein [Alphaproteobacteria bacterium]|nr:N-acyl homoserine lactonase family protein [Alphaproteobacteria bacterium]MBU1516343.1 N-acyl homoserine lactonase family protein [Alphaproteobacteria bacterium]MBU2093420.1 N-acyl homoserine lactonase family protein [Alphaproteobacteria bacterium]MBU2153907.1 N-acyl homoserine lactonase family protein [Alphaproteobacteria bacterium]MBU2307779.1 N-acyl homoserine lactonase family protein [Alphaproteobacteria bacterium]
MTLRLLAPAVAAALLFGAGAATAAKAPPKGVELYAMDCGRLTTENADAYADDGAYKGKTATMVVPCYLIRHPKGDLIWDTGVPQTIADRPNHTAPGGIVVTHKLTDQLKQLDLTPADIEYLSISHSHFDHIGNAGLFAGSTWIVDADERAYAFRAPARANAQGFAAYAALETAKTVLIEGDADYDVFGDGSVTIVQAPGHTPGHTVLLVKLKGAGPVLLTGDMWHLAQSRPERRVPRFNADRAQTLASMDKVEALAKATKARVILEHVPEDFDSLPKFPAPLR